ncbi:MAG: CRISPR-associated protein Cas4 [Methanosarcinaceae archaeon]|nr:CRISPR-associated protein Cas4 [Methanosarcinaceae archaeon]
MMNEGAIIIVTDVMEYLFCPRFIYFMHCLGMQQHEEKRFKVLKGREIHKKKCFTNKEYVRKKIFCSAKESEVFIVSKNNRIKGIVDEVLFMDDGSAAPFEYKFAEYKDKIFRTHKYQLILYGLMISENYGVEVNRGYICYTRSNNLVKQIDFKPSDFKKAIDMIKDVLSIVEKGVYPMIKKSPMKCVDCCYRNVCV